MAHDAFISYAHADGALARQISRHLEGQGLDIWLDESDIRIGSLLRDELRASILGSRTLILLWTQAAAASRWVAGKF
jgi:hypothetical protein